MSHQLIAARTMTDGPYCSIQRALDIVGERWTFLILREVLVEGETQFMGFTRALGIAPNILTDRLKTLVEAGILEKLAYQVPGSRPRSSYHPTAAGLDLKLVLAAIGQWGDNHVPHPDGPLKRRETTGDSRRVRVGFIDDEDHPRDVGEIKWVNAHGYPHGLHEERKNSER